MIKTIKGEFTLPLVGIAVVNSRSRTHKDWYNTCIDSVKNQFYPEYRISIINNTSKKKSIAECRNLAVKSLYDCKWILFVDDDDFIANDYLYSLVCFAENAESSGRVNWVSSNSTFFYNDNTSKTVEQSPIGMWRTEFLLINPFKESLIRFEDVELVSRLPHLNSEKLIINSCYGYYYRQHKGQNSRVKKEDEITHANNSKLKRTALDDYEKVKNGEYITSTH